MFSWNTNLTICWCGKATDPIESDRLDVISGRYDCLSNDTSSLGKEPTGPVKGNQMIVQKSVLITV